MIDPLYYEYYDKIFSKKDYKGEANTVLKVFQDVVGRTPKRILDVGCGTGSHDFVFAEKGIEVVGIDIDCDAIEVARQKCGIQTGNVPAFSCKNVSELEAGKFDLAVSLFNVINYIDRLDSLLAFFEAIHQRLVEQGLFIFDCWNGLAAILDLPRDKDSQLVVGDERIEVATRPRVELIDQRAVVDNYVSVTDAHENKRAFTFRYQQTLWTPWCLKNVLRLAGLETLKVTAWMQPDVVATHETWKILFTCQKDSNHVSGVGL